MGSTRDDEDDDDDEVGETGGERRGEKRLERMVDGVRRVGLGGGEALEGEAFGDVGGVRVAATCTAKES